VIVEVATDVAIPALLAGTFTQVSAGSLHTGGMQGNGYRTCWGANFNGQLNGYRVALPLAPRGY